MYYYNIGYDTPEDSHFIQVSSRYSFTHRQLAQIVEDCLADVLKTNPENTRFSDLIISSKFKDALVSRGFKPIKFKSYCVLFGWAKANVPGDWKSYVGSLTDKVQKSLAKRYPPPKEKDEES